MNHNQNGCQCKRPCWCTWLRWLVAAILAFLLLRGCMAPKAVDTAATLTAPAAAVATAWSPPGQGQHAGRTAGCGAKQCQRQSTGGSISSQCRILCYIPGRKNIHHEPGPHSPAGRKRLCNPAGSWQSGP